MGLVFDTERRTRTTIALHHDLAARATGTERRRHAVAVRHLQRHLPQSLSEALLLTLG